MPTEIATKGGRGGMKFSMGVEVGDKCRIRAMDCGRGEIRAEFRKTSGAGQG